MGHSEALALIAAMQKQLDDLRAYVLAQQASTTISGTAAIATGSIKATGVGTVRSGKPAAGRGTGRVLTTGTIWIEPMPWLQDGTMQEDAHA